MSSSGRRISRKTLDPRRLYEQTKQTLKNPDSKDIASVLTGGQGQAIVANEFSKQKKIAGEEAAAEEASAAKAEKVKADRYFHQRQHRWQFR